MTLFSPLLQRFSAQFSQDHAEKVYQMAKTALERKAWTPAVVSALLFSLVVYVFCIVYVIWEVWAWINHAWFQFFMAFLGCMVIALAISKMFSASPQTLSRQDFPALYGLVDQIADHLGHKSPISLTVDENFNAWYNQTPMGRVQVCLGLPLMYVASAQERVALISHEIAHGVNGDVLRSQFLHFPLVLLGNWYYMMIPDGLAEARASVGLRGGTGRAMQNLSMKILAMIPAQLLKLMERLVMVESQLAEYRADLLSSKVSGGHAAASMLDKLHFYSTYATSLHKHTLAPEYDHLYVDFANRMSKRKAEDLEDVRENYKSKYLAVMSHPPTILRMRFLQELANQQPTLELSEVQNKEITAELERMIPKLQAKAIDSYRNQMYE